MAKNFSVEQLKLNSVVLSGDNGNLFFNNSQVAFGADVVSSSRSVTAGDGLTGGGDLSANRTFNVGAGSGIYVSADAIHVNTNGIISSMITDSSITSVKINDSAVSTVKIADSAVTNAKITDGTIANAKLVNNSITVAGGSGLSPDTTAVSLGGTVTLNIVAGSGITVSSDAVNITPLGISTAMIADSAVTNAKITDGTIANAKLVNNSITVVGGSGLLPNTTVVNLGESITLNVQTDNSTLEISSDALRVKAGSIGNSQLGINYAGSASQGGAASSVANSLTNSLGILALSYNGSAAATVSVDSQAVVMMTGAQTIAGAKTFSNNIVIGGDLTVNGTTTSVNSNEVNIGDNKIILNSDATTGTASDGGIQVYTGVAASPELLWVQSTRQWSLSTDGTNYYEIASSKKVRAGTSVLSTNDSSKTISFGYTFPSTPVVVVSLQASTGVADMILTQISSISTTQVVVELSAPIPNTATYTVNWHAISSLS